MDQVAAVYAYYPVFMRTGGWSDLPAAEREAAVAEAQSLLDAAAPAVTVRGIYSTVGFRADADVMMWWVGDSPDALQDLLVAFRRTRLGRHLDLSWAFMGLHRPPEFARDHVPAFVRGVPPAKYLCVYPFVRTPEWYRLEPQQRGELLRAHGGLGRDFGDVLTNTTQAFGLGDWEWILAFESERMERIVDMIRTLRAAEARLYTKEEIPFISGIRKDLAQVARDL